MTQCNSIKNDNAEAAEVAQLVALASRPDTGYSIPSPKRWKEREAPHKLSSDLHLVTTEELTHKTQMFFMN